MESHDLVARKPHTLVEAVQESAEKRKGILGPWLRVALCAGVEAVVGLPSGTDRALPVFQVREQAVPTFHGQMRCSRELVEAKHARSLPAHVCLAEKAAHAAAGIHLPRTGEARKASRANQLATVWLAACTGLEACTGMAAYFCQAACMVLAACTGPVGMRLEPNLAVTPWGLLSSEQDIVEERMVPSGSHQCPYSWNCILSLSLGSHQACLQTQNAKESLVAGSTMIKKS